MNATILAALLLAPAADAGTFRYEPVADQGGLPERYRLAARDFTYRLEDWHTLPVCQVVMQRLTFPSPVVSPHECNNTVHAEYYRTTAPGRRPSVVVLDITGGNQELSRSIATFLAQNRINALFVQMAYYGPRRPSEGKVRLLSTDIPRTLDAVRQTVFDVRVAGNWLASRPENDPARVGILGTSLGSMMAALCAETEPRFARSALLLGGGGLVDAFYDHPQAKPYRTAYELLGGKKERVKELIAPADPLTLADRLKGRDVLMLNASRDEIVPPSATTALWEAAGRPKIRWFDTTHYGAIIFFPTMLRVVVDYYNAP
ncbi:MAG: alpha/beta hydrolase family protein [Gemmataceae bacterium]|nr:alpha/beta hydrolase family protein [Gemmataceae bacterium]